ncbi:MAG: hypothetical protein ABFD94_13625, partial [Armatimonadia bacterium]
AEKYGGNKQKIAEAASLGALGPEGPLLAVAAGMYIDRMRAAQMQEQVPQQTVAQQVLTPQPQAPQMPQGGPGLSGIAPPQMSAPPMAGGAPAPAEGQPAPAMGMAEGGYLPPYASGGLTDLPVPDGMFDEPSDGGFAGGGLVAFAGGGETDANTSYGYNYKDPMANAAIYERLYGKPETKYAQEVEQDFLRRRGEDYKKAQRRKDIGQLMAEAGFGMLAGTSPNALTNIGAALLPALSNAGERAKERRAEEREIQKGLLDIEAGRNTAAAQKAGALLQMQQTGMQGREAELGREFQATQAELGRKHDFALEGMRQSGRAALRGSSGGDGGGGDSGRGTTVTANRYTEIQQAYTGARKDYNKAYQAWLRAGQPKRTDPNPGRAAIAQTAYDAAQVWHETEKMLNSVRPRGGRPAAAPAPAAGGKGKPAGVTQAVWDAMTPQERALFK